MENQKSRETTQTKKINQQKKAAPSQNQLFAPVQSQKKKKVRPDKKTSPVDDNEGFEEVGKKKNYQKKKRNEGEEEYPKKQFHSKKEGANYHVKDDSKPMRKREYERHSGTGRGKEVAKGGAGGRGTWGDNPKNIARNYERNNDDYIINSALNPEAQKERKERYEKKEKYVKEEKGERTFEPKEIPEAEKLKIPEGAISVEEFLKQKAAKTSEVKQVEKPKETESLQVKAKEENNSIGLSVEVNKKEKKLKQKKVNKKEEELNQQVFENLKVEDNSNNNRRRYDDKRHYNKGGHQKKDNFHFNPDEFPEL